MPDERVVASHVPAASYALSKSTKEFVGHNSHCFTVLLLC